MVKPKKEKERAPAAKSLKKSLTGINGFDEITGGGIPLGRPTLICGGPGCGKTLFAIEYIVKGAMQYGEPGVFMTFEERAEELQVNVASLGFDLDKLQHDKLLKVDYVHIDKSEIEETGEYDLEGLFIRLGYAIESIGAKRVVLDTIENLFMGLNNQATIRAEIRRLFQWLKEKKVTTVVTGEKGVEHLTRQGLEEYVSDCVILLDNRVSDQITTRLLRIIKYRGSVHGTNEFPFLIDEEGISVLPVTSLKLNNKFSNDRISTGIPSLNEMLGGIGFFRESSILVSGTAGTGKTSLATYFANETCMRKERCVYMAFEESPQQIMRNMSSTGINLEEHVKNGYLQFHASRPTLYGLEMHLVAIHKIIKKFKPRVIILDPISSLIGAGNLREVKAMIIRLIDFLQVEQITVMFTALTLTNIVNEQMDEGLSSMVDTWLVVRDIELNGERNRGMCIRKSRGMNHSNKIREFVISDHGLDLVDVCVGPEGILTGSAREAHQLLERTEQLLRNNAVTTKNRELERRRLVLESKIASLNAEFESVQEELNKTNIEDELKNDVINENRMQLRQKRHQELSTSFLNGRNKS
ncbi:MAG TPA: circadian clock protein KaiC [Chitinophagaceae bacterium]|nr:circadian clock protein KaiC [Chitinophagaceae bacterium]